MSCLNKGPYNCSRFCSEIWMDLWLVTQREAGSSPTQPSFLPPTAPSPSPSSPATHRWEGPAAPATCTSWDWHGTKPSHGYGNIKPGNNAQVLIVLLLNNNSCSLYVLLNFFSFLNVYFNFSQVTLTGVSVNVTNEFGLSVVPWRHYRRTHRNGYMCTLPATYPHTIVWDLPIEHEVDTTFYSAGMFRWRRNADHTKDSKGDRKTGILKLMPQYTIMDTWAALYFSLEKNSWPRCSWFVCCAFAFLPHSFHLHTLFEVRCESVRREGSAVYRKLWPYCMLHRCLQYSSNWSRDNHPSVCSATRPCQPGRQLRANWEWAATSVRSRPPSVRTWMMFWVCPVSVPTIIVHFTITIYTYMIWWRSKFT